MFDEYLSYRLIHCLTFWLNSTQSFDYIFFISMVCRKFSPNSEQCAVTCDVILLSVPLCAISEQLLIPLRYVNRI
jgi:hypothetical protein